MFLFFFFFFKGKAELIIFFFFSSRRRHTRLTCDWSSDVCSSDLDDEGGWIPAQRPDQLRAGVEANLRTLGVEQVDVVNLRLIDELPGGQPIPADQRVDLDSQLAEMSALRDEGKIGGIGLSNTSAGQLRRALPAGIAC